MNPPACCDDVLPRSHEDTKKSEAVRRPFFVSWSCGGDSMVLIRSRLCRISLCCIALCRIVLCCSLAIAVCGCGADKFDGDQGVAYVCTETQAVVVDAPQPTPAVNPHTGRRTLVRGMYCDKCQEWFPVPPDARHPEGIRCRKHGTPMSLDGPLPESAAVSHSEDG